MHRLMPCTSQPCARVLGRGREAVQGMWKSALQHQESPRACSPASWAVGSAVTGVRSGGWGESGHGAVGAGSWLAMLFPSVFLKCSLQSAPAAPEWSFQF